MWWKWTVNTVINGLIGNFHMGGWQRKAKINEFSEAENLATCTNDKSVKFTSYVIVYLIACSK